MPKLSNTKASSTASVILYGAPKTGKTLLAGNLAEHFNLIWIDLENGHDTLYQLPQAWQERIDLVDIPDSKAFPMAIETCLKVVKGPVDICVEHGKVGCLVCKKSEGEFTHVDLNSLGQDTIVVFDSLTQLTSSALANITKGKPDDYKLEFDDWGNLGKLMDIFLSHIQQARYNVVVISHENEVEVANKKKSLVPMGGSSKFSRNVAKYFGHVVYAERKNKKHMFTSSSTAEHNILTGSRTSVALEDNGDSASLLQIFKPELFPDKPVNKTKPKIGANNILNKLKK